MERFLIEHCAPTLARIKPASLFSCPAESAQALRDGLDSVNRQLNDKDVFLQVLRFSDGRALILVYRKSLLQRTLRQINTADFLSGLGYRGESVSDCISHLIKRCSENKDFPHEIGIFLGYPLEDVIGFIENSGQNSKCAGCWKVYSDECKAQKLFEQYKKCTEIYMRLFLNGKSIKQLTVAA